MTTAEIIRLLALCAHIIFGFVAAVVISLRRKPATAIAWILTIVFIPILGAVAFFLVGFGQASQGAPRQAARGEHPDARALRRVGPRRRAGRP